jgi:alpha-beta hydrolase superfamily lysophospholipase
MRALVAMALIAVSVVGIQAAGRPVSFRSDDGRVVNALFFEAERRPSPAVVLVPMLGRPKDDWQNAGQRFADAGITALAIELPSQSIPADPKELMVWQGTVRAATGFLASRPEGHGAIGAAGASLGANLAALAASADPRIRSLALVSPTLEYRGVRIEGAMRTYGERPALLLASVHDAYAARSARGLAKDAPGLRELRWSETAAHGTVLLARDPALVNTLVEWFQRTLGSP